MVDLLRSFESPNRNKEREAAAKKLKKNVRGRLGLEGPTKSFTQTTPTLATPTPLPAITDNQTNQGGQGGLGNSAGQGAVLGGNNQQQLVDSSGESLKGFQRLGQTPGIGNDRVTTNFSDNSGTASVATSAAGAQRLAAGGGTVSSLDFSGARATPAGAQAELNALRQGQRLGLSPGETLSFAEDARISALPPGIDKEIASITKQRDDGTLNPAVAQERLNNLFQRKSTQTNAETNQAELALKEQQGTDKIAQRQAEQNQKNLLDQQKQRLSQIKDLGASRVASVKAKDSVLSSLTNRGLSPESPEGQREILGVGIAGVSNEIEDLKASISAKEKPELLRQKAANIIREMTQRGTPINQAQLTKFLGTGEILSLEEIQAQQ